MRKRHKITRRQPWESLSFSSRAFFFRKDCVDHDVFDEVTTYDYYLLKELTAPPVNVLDIGAHIGSFSCWCSYLFPASHIWAFEPHPKNYEILQENMRLYPNVTIHNVALSDHDGLAFMNNDLVNTGGNWVVPKGIFPIQVADVMRFMTRKYDFAKFDCEGGEKPVLKRLAEAGVLKDIKTIVGEFHGGEAMDLVLSLGAKIVGEVTKPITNITLGKFRFTH